MATVKPQKTWEAQLLQLYRFASPVPFSSPNPTCLPASEHSYQLLRTRNEGKSQSMELSCLGMTVKGTLSLLCRVLMSTEHHEWVLNYFYHKRWKITTKRIPPCCPNHATHWYLQSSSLKKAPLLLNDLTENQILCWYETRGRRKNVGNCHSEANVRWLEPRYSWLCMYASMYSVHLHVSHFHTYILYK